MKDFSREQSAQIEADFGVSKSESKVVDKMTQMEFYQFQFNRLYRF